MKSKEEQYKEALELSFMHHRYQVDKSNEPYFRHVFRVSEMGDSIDERIVGLLHDLIEDTSVTINLLIEKIVLLGLVTAWRFAGWLALKGEKFNEALQFYEKAYELKPTHDACRRLGLTLVDLERYEEGAAYLEEAYRLNRSDHNSLFNASVAYASAENYQKALNLAEQLARINPNFPDLQMWRMHLLTRNE